MASAQVLPSSAASSRKQEHLQAGKRRVRFSLHFFLFFFYYFFFQEKYIFLSEFSSGFVCKCLFMCTFMQNWR